VISLYSSSIKVVRRLKDSMGINLHLVDASNRFLTALEGVSDPERKRKIIGATFIEIFQVSTIIALFTPHCISFLRCAFCEHSASGLLYVLYYAEVAICVTSSSLRSSGGGQSHRKSGLLVARNSLPRRDREHLLQGALRHYQDTSQCGRIACHHETEAN
jgi:hypothetical protein